MRKQKIVGKKKYLSIVLDPMTYDKLDREAFQRDMSKALIVSEALKERYGNPSNRA